MNAKATPRKKLAATDARNLRTLLLLSVFAPEDIGARLKSARLEAGLTQEELADLVGVSTRSWQGYESGAVVPYRHIGKIAEITRRPIAWILHGDDDQPGDADPAWLGPLREELSVEISRLRLLNDELEAERAPAPPARKRRGS